MIVTKKMQELCTEIDDDGLDPILDSSQPYYRSKRDNAPKMAAFKEIWIGMRRTILAAATVDRTTPRGHAAMIVAEAVARGIEGMGYKELILNSDAVGALTDNEVVELRAAFNELIGELYARGGKP